MSISTDELKAYKNLLAHKLADLDDALSSCNPMGCSGAVTVLELVQITRRHTANILNVSHWRLCNSNEGAVLTLHVLFPAGNRIIGVRHRWLVSLIFGVRRRVSISTSLDLTPAFKSSIPSMSVRTATI